jgi:hypothetical protein
LHSGGNRGAAGEPLGEGEGEGARREGEAGEENGRIVMLRRIVALTCATAVVAVLAAGCGEGPKKPAATGGGAAAGAAAAAKTLKPQETCPVTGAKVDRKLYVDAGGYRIYVCCQGCVAAVKADPQKYVKVLEGRGEAVEKPPAGGAGN